MSKDDTTPIHPHPSGEWPSWADMLVSEMRTTRKSVESMSRELASHVGDDKVMRSQVDGLLKRQDNDDSDARQLGLGTKLAIVSAIASPLIVIAVEAFKH